MEIQKHNCRNLIISLNNLVMLLFFDFKTNLWIGRNQKSKFNFGCLETKYWEFTSEDPCSSGELWNLGPAAGVHRLQYEHAVDGVAQRIV